MSNENVFKVCRIAPCFCVKVRSPVSETSVADNLHHCLYKVEIVNRELVRIPAVLIVAAVGVNRAEHSGIYGTCKLMLKRMAGESCVVNFDVELEVLVKAMGLKETYHSLRINVILMLGRLHRLRLYEECAGESL